MLLPTQPWCSAPCADDPSSFHRHVLSIVSAASASVKSVHVRNTSSRIRHHRLTCAKLQLGCLFLEKGWRVLLPKVILPKLGYNGSSAEVGVWQGHFSSIILNDWTNARGNHFLVDPYRALACPTNVRASRLDKHCALNSRAFDAAYAQATLLVEAHQSRVAPNARRRAQFMRSESVAAAQAIADESLDFAYLDAGHDHHSVRNDLHAWARKLCPGGLLAGHDFSERGVRTAVHEFLNRRRPLEGLPKPPRELFADGRLFVTAEHPASWFLFRRPRPCNAPL